MTHPMSTTPADERSTPARWSAAGAAIPIIASFAALASSGCRHEAPRPTPVPEISVTAVHAATSDVPVHRDYPASLVSVRSVVLEARVEGWLLQQQVPDGSMVEPGQVVYEIDPAPFIVALDQAKADLAVADANRANAFQKFDRNRPLVAVDAISQEQFDSLEAEFLAAEAQVLARKAAVEQAELNLSYCTVISPTRGQLSRSQVFEGALVGPNMNRTLNNVRQLDPIWVQFQPVSQDIPALRSLMKAGEASTIATLPGSTWSAKGKVVFLDNEVGARTSTILARLEIPNADLAVVPGMYLSVRLLVDTLRGAITVPTEAIVYQSAQAMVWVVEADGSVKPATIETGPAGGLGTVVTKGLAGGEQVVTKGQLKLKPGAKVKIVPDAPPPSAPASAPRTAPAPASAPKAASAPAPAAPASAAPTQGRGA